MFELSIKDSYYLGIIFLAFYALPLAAQLLQIKSLAVINLLVLMPLVVIIVSLLRGLRQGISLLFVAAAALLFVPSIFIFYNASAYGYAVLYALASCLGNVAGYFTQKYFVK